MGSPSHGSLSGSAPNHVYTPNIPYSGLDSFTFKANDGHDDSAITLDEKSQYFDQVMGLAKDSKNLGLKQIAVQALMQMDSKNSEVQELSKALAGDRAKMLSDMKSHSHHR